MPRTTLGEANVSPAPPDRPERRLLTHGRARLPGRLDTPWLDLELTPPPLDELVALAAGQHVVVWGGEPSLRPDLPALLSGLQGPTLRTDGLALTQRPLMARLAACHLAAVRLPLCSGRRDANDWLLGRRGATRATIAAARAATAEGLRLEFEIVLTRPTASHLTETVDLAARLGAAAVRIRRLVRRGPADPAFVALSPRFGLLEPWIEQALRAARRHGMEASLEGLPRCAAPQAPDEAFAPPATWLVPSGPGWAEAAARMEPTCGRVRCGGCSDASGCAGAPDDYTALFGALEFESEIPPGENTDPPAVPPGIEAPTIPPPPRAGRRPSTRLRAVHEQLARGSLGGDPLAPRRPAFAALVQVAWTAEEPARSVRIRLVRAGQEGASTLRIAGGTALQHPAAAALLREATRLSVSRLELRGELSGLQAFSDDELRRLRRFTAVVAELFGPTPEAHDAALGQPGAFAASAEALARLHRATRRRVEIAFAATPPWTGPELPAPLLPTAQ